LLYLFTPLLSFNIWSLSLSPFLSFSLIFICSLSFHILLRFLIFFHLSFSLCCSLSLLLNLPLSSFHSLSFCLSTFLSCSRNLCLPHYLFFYSNIIFRSLSSLISILVKRMLSLSLSLSNIFSLFLSLKNTPARTHRFSTFHTPLLFFLLFFLSLYETLSLYIFLSVTQLLTLFFHLAASHFFLSNTHTHTHFLSLTHIHTLVPLSFFHCLSYSI